MLSATAVASGARSPRPYQVEGSGWLLEKGRALLTDGFGLGKTSQAVWAAETPTMIACPRHLIPHWVREIQACRPGAVVRAADAPDLARRKQQLDGVADFYVFNIELFRTNMDKWLEPLRARRIQTLIVDEAHRLRGRNSAQTRGAQIAANLVARVYLLTATPVYNLPDDLFALLRLLDPNTFTSYYRFCDTYLRVLQTPWGPKILGLKRDKKLKEVFAGYALGRTREEVQAQLPIKQETLVEIEADPDFYALYKKTRRTYKDRYERMLLSQQSVLQALRTLTQQAKLHAVVQLVIDAGVKDVLIYTYHRSLAYAIGDLLKIPVITGDMPATKREAVARAHDMVVATFPSVSEGINLSHMQTVIYCEHDWMPGIMDQSLHRVHRPGSPHTHTNVYHVVVKRTVDAVVYKSYKTRELTMDEIVAASLVPFDDDDTDTEGDDDEG